MQLYPPGLHAVMVSLRRKRSSNKHFLLLSKTSTSFQTADTWALACGTKTESSDLGSLVGALKGSYAVIKRVADELNMNAQLKLVYEDEDEGHWDGDFDDEEEEDVDGEQEEGSRTRWILLDDANQYPESILEDDDSVKVSVASSGGVILCKPDKKVRFNQVSLSYHLSKLTGKLVGRIIHGLRRLHRQPSKSLLGNSTHEVLESEECICEIWKPCECRVYLWGFVFDG